MISGQSAFLSWNVGTAENSDSERSLTLERNSESDIVSRGYALRGNAVHDTRKEGSEVLESIEEDQLLGGTHVRSPAIHLNAPATGAAFECHLFVSTCSHSEAACRKLLSAFVSDTPRERDRVDLSIALTAASVRSGLRAGDARGSSLCSLP